MKYRAGMAQKLHYSGSRQRSQLVKELARNQGHAPEPKTESQVFVSSTGIASLSSKPREYWHLE